jgi:hypothetical protein
MSRIAQLLAIVVSIACAVGHTDGVAAVASDPLQTDSHEAHRRGDESVLEQMLMQHRSAAEEESTAQRVAIRRRIHEQHIEAHLAVDPDVSTEATDDVRQRFESSRRKLLEAATKPTTGFRLTLLIGIAVLPMVGFAVWMKL